MSYLKIIYAPGSCVRRAIFPFSVHKKVTSTELARIGCPTLARMPRCLGEPYDPASGPGRPPRNLPKRKILNLNS